MAPSKKFSTVRSMKRNASLPVNFSGSPLSNNKENNFKTGVKRYQASIRRRDSMRFIKWTNMQELDLEQKIELEIKMREGSAKLLAASKQQAQSLEAARSLLTSNERMSAYMAELQRRKRDPQLRNLQSRARVSLSELRMPLMWRGVDHFKNKGDYRRFAVFCLARVGTEIFDTALVSPVDRSMTDITFSDSLVFNNVPADFTFRLEVYSHLLAEDLSMASTPRKLQRTLHSSISRTVGKKLAASLKDELHGKLGPQFHLVASAKLNLADIDDGVRTHDLEIETLDNRMQELPLFGHFCCRLAAQPDCMTKELICGEATLRQGSKAAFCPVFLSLKAFRLSVWPSRELRTENEPTASLCVDKEASIQVGDNRQVHIVRLEEGREVTWTIQAKTAEEQQQWLGHLMRSAQDHARWRKASERLMDIPSPGSSRQSFMSTCSRQGSLYDQTPLIENVCSESQQGVQNGSNRRTVQEIFGLTPATSLSSCASSSASSSPPTSFRDRTSSGSGSGFRATLRGHWPFKSSN
ncbi:rhotekin-like isoform X2 [Neocloeon triangulifer]|uniref:rhotekin-like isoform X2 n=1 Tax=Neocloeon triangulifer TaxID=2078957 RepID=UPI00286EEAAD|nr:rhotekin-like isoform X2 [Neocloeon triangulifer]